jgi:hypothetical protein
MKVRAENSDRLRRRQGARTAKVERRASAPVAPQADVPGRRAAKR